MLPAFKDFVLEEEAGKVLLRWVGGKVTRCLVRILPVGWLAAPVLLADFAEACRPSGLPDVMFFDEPEWVCIRTPSPWWRRCSSVCRKAANFIATQSPYLVDCFELENIIVANANNGETMLRNLPREHYQRWLDEEYQLSDIWLQQAAGGVVWLGISACPAGRRRRGGEGRMIRVCIICEGPTEVEFVNRCLEPLSAAQRCQRLWHCVERQKAPSGGRHRRPAGQKISLHSSEADRVSTLVDFTVFKTAQAALAPVEADIASAARAITTAYDPRYVLPYVQRHEFEACYSPTPQTLNGQKTAGAKR